MGNVGSRGTCNALPGCLSQMLCWSRKCHRRGSFSLPFDVVCVYPLAPSCIACAGRHPRPWRPRDTGSEARHKARSPRRGGERRQRRFLASRGCVGWVSRVRICTAPWQVSVFHACSTALLPCLWCPGRSVGFLKRFANCTQKTFAQQLPFRGKQLCEAPGELGEVGTGGARAAPAHTFCLSAVEDHHKVLSGRSL